MKTLHFKPSTPEYFAHQEAQLAAEHARLSRQLRPQIEKYRLPVTRWTELTQNAPIAFFNTIFGISFVGDLLISWEIYADLVSGVLPSMPLAGILCIGLLVNGTAALLAHIGAKSCSASMFDVEVFNILWMKHRGNFPTEIAQRQAEQTMRSERKFFILGALFLICFVGLLSLQRTGLFQIINGKPTVSPIDVLLPIVAVSMEIVSGIFVGFTIRLEAYKFRLRQLEIKFNKHLEACHQHDQVAWNQCMLQAAPVSENLPFDLKESILRAEYRTLDEHYADPFELASEPVPKID